MKSPKTMTKEKEEFFIRLLSTVSIGVFAYFLFSKNASTTSWVILAAILVSQAIYYLLKGPKRSRWVNVFLFLGGIMGIFGYVYFAN